MFNLSFPLLDSGGVPVNGATLLRRQGSACRVLLLLPTLLLYKKARLSIGASDSSEGRHKTNVPYTPVE
jgi:hypothetical protein